MRHRTWLAGLVILTACRAAFAGGQPSPSAEPMPVVRLRSGASAFSTYTGVADRCERSFAIPARGVFSGRRSTGRSFRRPHCP